MAGIAGIVYPDRLSAHRDLQPMLDLLAHRNPTGECYRFHDKTVELGIAGSSYLLEKKRKNSLVLFDGKLWRRQKLASSLSSAGYSLDRGGSDEELILCSYDHWGEAFLSQLEGDFALALYDKKKGVLILARDRIGVKPLYWYYDHSYFLFASELKALLTTSYVPQAPSSEAIASYMMLGYIPQDMTPIEKVNKLLPSYYLRLDLNRTMSIIPYWSLSSCFLKREAPRSLSEELKDSLEERLDSTKALCSPPPDSLGSLALDSLLKDRACRIEPQKLPPESLFSALPELIWYLDEPIASPHVATLWSLALSLSKKDCLFFSDVGAQTLFAKRGAPFRENIKAPFKSAWRSFLHFLVKKTLLKAGFHPPFSLIKFLESPPWLSDYFEQRSLLSEKEMNELSPSLSPFFNPQTFLNKFHHLDRLSSHLNSSIYLDMKTSLPDRDLLPLERLFSAYHIPWRAPYIDRSFIEAFAAASNGGPPPSEELFPLCQKERFQPEWTNLSIAKSASFQSQARLLLRGTLVETGMLSREWLAYSTLSSKQILRFFSQLWSMLVLELWFRLFINRPTLLGKPSLTSEELLKGR